MSFTVEKKAYDSSSFASGHSEKSITDEGLDTRYNRDAEHNSSFSCESLSNSYEEKDEKNLVRRLDFWIMPLFCLFYFVDFLDRANIGNAKLAGLQEDLNMTGFELNIAISAFFITYILFEIPYNMILKRTHAGKWLSFTMLIWGIATLVTAFVTNFGGLLVARLVLGAAESGYIPGTMFLLSKVYKPQEFTFRVSILVTMAPLSGFVSGPLAYSMNHFDGLHGLHDWQYLFIFEGAPTIFLAFVSYFCLFDDLQKVKWLTTNQKILQAKRMVTRQSIESNDNNPIDINTFKSVFYDWKTWAFSFVYLLSSINITSINVFLPTLINGLGFSTLTSQLLAAPPSLAAMVGVLLGGYLAGKLNNRSPLIVVGSSVVAVGYLLLLLLHDKWALYSALFAVSGGMGMQGATAIGWSAINYPDLNDRAVAVAAVLMIGNGGNIIASYLFRSEDAPKYVFGIVFNMVVALISAILAAVSGYLLYRENCRRDRYPTEDNYFRFFY